MTEIKIRIRTPKGQATGTQHKMQPILIGSKKKLVKFRTYVNKDDSELYWQIETDLRRSMKITRNVSMYKEMIQLVLGNKTVNKMIKEPGQKEELRKMLSDQTRVDIIKKADADELVEYNKTFWQRVTEKFKKGTEEEK